MIIDAVLGIIMLSVTNKTTKLSVPFMPCVIYAEFHKLNLYIECCYAESPYAECHYTECHK
jgi:hypothetical protein